MGLRSGERLKKYIIQDLIASGGMGEVWRALDLDTNQSVAIKAITRDLVYDPNFYQRFLDEARRHSKLNHPNIVPVFDIFEAENQNCLVMEKINGVSLSDLLHSRQQRMEASEAIPIIRDVLNALNYAHRHGVIHRDVKPSNILVDNNGRTHLIDFGIALAVGEDRRTRAGQAIGTPDYMSPEQIVRPGEVDHRSDVYSVGCVFYEMVTGRPPFIALHEDAGDTDFAIKQAHVNTKPIGPKERVSSIPKALDEIIILALQKDPKKRIPGCQEFLRLLDELERPSFFKRYKTDWVMSALLILSVLLLILIGLLIVQLILP